jgi:hypothetical protein
MEECIHVWQIAEAQGPTSQGVCQVCHATKDFKNHVESKGFGQSSEEWLKARGNNDRFRVER